MKHLVVLMILVFVGCTKTPDCDSKLIVTQNIQYVGYDDNKIHYVHSEMNECDCLDNCFEYMSQYLQHLNSIDTSTIAGKNEYKFYKGIGKPTCDCK